MHVIFISEEDRESLSKVRQSFVTRAANLWMPTGKLVGSAVRPQKLIKCCWSVEGATPVASPRRNPWTAALALGH
jgi:hypothetical protein